LATLRFSVLWQLCSSWQSDVLPQHDEKARWPHGTCQLLQGADFVQKSVARWLQFKETKFRHIQCALSILRVKFFMLCKARLLMSAGTSTRPNSPIFFFAKLSPNAADLWYLQQAEKTPKYANNCLKRNGSAAGATKQQREMEIEHVHTQTDTGPWRHVKAHHRNASKRLSLTPWPKW
jgi:hypothetical protein